MSEERVLYTTHANEQTYDTLDIRDGLVRAQLEDIERKLIPLLVSIQRALGKELTVRTRLEKRGE